MHERLLVFDERDDFSEDFAQKLLQPGENASGVDADGGHFDVKPISGSVFVNEVVRRIHAAALVFGSISLRSGLSQTGPICDQLRVFPDHRSGFEALAFA